MPIVDTVSNLSPELQRVYQDAMKAEKKALQPINERKTDVSKKIELLNDVIGKVEEVKKLMPGLSTPNGFRELTFLSGDEKIVSGTVNKDVAEPGTHSFEVLQLANKATALTNIFEDKNQTRVGTGYLVFTNDKGEQKEIFIDDDNSTLEGVASSINKARAGVKATVIQDTVYDEDEEDPIHGFRLMLTSEKTGLGNNPEYPEFYLVDGDEDLFIESENLASNAVLKYEGHKAEFPSNQVNELIKGVTLDLRATTEPGKAVTVNIEEDTAKVKTKVKDFVDKINQVFSFIQTQSKMDKDTNTRQTLGGEYSIRMMDSRLKEALQTNFIDDPTRVIRTLGDLGIQFNKKGTLDYDEKKLENAIKTDIEGVSLLLSGDILTEGIMTKVGKTLNSLTSADSGVLAVQKQNLKNKEMSIVKQLETKEKIIEKKAEVLKGNLGKVQGAISMMQSQSNFLNAQMASIVPPK